MRLGQQRVGVAGRQFAIPGAHFAYVRLRTGGYEGMGFAKPFPRGLRQRIDQARPDFVPHARFPLTQTGATMSAIPELLRRRFDMVARLSEITSRQQKFQQARMSAEMDVQRCEMADGEAAQRERNEALARAQSADDSIAACEALIAEIEAGLDATDREIAAQSGRRASS